MAGAAAIPEPVMDQPHIPFIALPTKTPEPIQNFIAQAAPIQAPSVRSIPMTQSTAAAQTPAPQAATPEPITSTTTLENASLAMKRLGKAFGGKRVH